MSQQCQLQKHVSRIKLEVFYSWKVNLQKLTMYGVSQKIWIYFINYWQTASNCQEPEML